MQQTRHETLQEFTDARGVRLHVDRGQSVIRGVKILGLRSRNGRVYLPAALAGAKQLYEGAKVNVNHPKGHPHSPRDYQDRIGTLRNVAIREAEGLFGDLHLNPAHALAEQLLWDAEHAPDNVGLSHNVQAQTVKRGDATVVEAILKVQAVDLVADPATTRGLFEETNHSWGEPAILTNEPSCPVGAGGSATPLIALEGANVSLHELRAQRDALQSEVQRLRALTTRQQRRDTARRLLLEAGLPDPDSCNATDRVLVNDAFVDNVIEAESEAAMRSLVLERAQLIEAARRSEPLGSRQFARELAARPRSREQQPGSTLAPITTVDEFVRAITT